MRQRIVYRIPTKVIRVEEKKRITKAWMDETKTPPVAMQETENLGWYVHFAGSFESLCVGPEKPLDLAEGAEVDILITPRGWPAG